MHLEWFLCFSASFVLIRNLIYFFHTTWAIPKNKFIMCNTSEYILSPSLEKFSHLFVITAYITNYRTAPNPYPCCDYQICVLPTRQQIVIFNTGYTIFLQWIHLCQCCISWPTVTPVLFCTSLLDEQNSKLFLSFKSHFLFLNNTTFTSVFWPSIYLAISDKTFLYIFTYH